MRESSGGAGERKFTLRDELNEELGGGRRALCKCPPLLQHPKVSLATEQHARQWKGGGKVGEIRGCVRS